jgi:hypothetical protein
LFTRRKTDNNCLLAQKIIKRKIIMERLWTKTLLGSALLLTLVGCGTMRINETHYYAVEDQNNTNVFRLKITGKSRLGDAKYQSGYYPSYAVDRVFGDIRGNGGTADLEAQEALATEIRNATLKTTKNYLQLASESNSTDEAIQKALNARRNILAYPSLNTGLPANSRIIDYRPSQGIVLRNAGSKMVYVFSSNPDDVIGNIKNFAESDLTALAVSRLAQVTSQQTRNNVVELEATLSVMEEGITNQITQFIENLLGDGDADKTIMVEQLTILNAYLKGVQP